MSENIYGYKGRLNQQVIELIAECWPIVAGGMAEGTPWNLTKSNFCEIVVEEGMNRLPVALWPDDHPSFKGFSADKIKEIQEAQAKNAPIQNERQAQRKAVMAEAGYIVGDKVDAVMLWHDLEKAGLTQNEGMMGKGPQISGGQHWYFEKENAGRHLRFDADGLFMAGSLPSERVRYRLADKQLWQKEISVPKV